MHFPIVKLLLRRLGHQALRLPLLPLPSWTPAGRSSHRKQTKEVLVKTAKMKTVQFTAVRFTNVVDVKWSSLTMMIWVITWQRFIHSCAIFAIWNVWITMEDSSTITQSMYQNIPSVFMQTLLFCKDLNSD